MPQVWHDNAGIGAAWHLDTVTVRYAAEPLKYYFYCGQWLDAKHGLERHITASLTDPRLSLRNYKVKATGFYIVKLLYLHLLVHRWKCAPLFEQLFTDGHAIVWPLSSEK